jgi:hypothetical protein
MIIHPHEMATTCHLENITKQAFRLGTLKRTGNHNREVYVNNHKARLGQAAKQCTGLHQLAHFCIYYFARS